MFNPTNCEALTVGGAFASTVGAAAPVSSRFQAANCATLKFAPKFTMATAGKASKAGGVSLDVKVASKGGPQPGGGEANIRSVKVDLPKQLPSRLTTLQKACLASVFDANPANCPKESDVGSATAATPVLAHPLTGPAYLVSHGGAAFPDLEIVLQGEGIVLILDGSTNIKKGVTVEYVQGGARRADQLVRAEAPHREVLRSYAKPSRKGKVQPLRPEPCGADCDHRSERGSDQAEHQDRGYRLPKEGQGAQGDPPQGVRRK